MGEVISATADVTRIEDHIRTAFEKATARGGDIAAAAAQRLSPAVITIDGAVPLRKAARKASGAAWNLVLAEDAKADAGIGSVRDAMWNALGRPRQSQPMDEVFPGGIGTYTSGDPLGQPLLMQVLQARILSAPAPQWSDDKRKGWAAEIEALRVPYAAAVEAHQPAEATTVVAEAGYRAAVRRRARAPRQLQARSQEPRADRGADSRDHPRRGRREESSQGRRRIDVVSPARRAGAAPPRAPPSREPYRSRYGAPPARAAAPSEPALGSRLPRARARRFASRRAPARCLRGCARPRSGPRRGSLRAPAERLHPATRAADRRSRPASWSGGGAGESARRGGRDPVGGGEPRWPGLPR